MLEPLIQSWRTMMPSPWREIALALMAVICGGIVGSERQKREKPAGMRTLILVSLGSATFTMLSFVFNTVTGDSGRVVAQIVTGIGFLGAGVIMRDHGLISGATTAAMIWVTAAMGVVVGSGYAFAGLGLGILVRLTLKIVNHLETASLRKIPPVPVMVDFDRDHGRTRVQLQRIMGDFNIPAACIHWAFHSESDARLTLRLQLPGHHLLELLNEIVQVPAVKAVHGLPEDAIEGMPKQVF